MEFHQRFRDAAAGLDERAEPITESIEGIKPFAFP
jgi:hypothetical protein